MGIYIFEPSGAGGSQTLQQVLSTGSNLTITNNINGTNNGLYFDDFSFFNISTSVLNINNQTGGNFIQIDPSFNLFVIGVASNYQFRCSYLGANLLVDIFDTANFTTNIFQINTQTIVMQFGDYMNYVNGTQFRVDDNGEDIYGYANATVRFTTQNFILTETATGNGDITFNGTGYYSATAPAIPQGHLKIILNGQIRYIALTGL